jgi:hypothetical protein
LLSLSLKKGKSRKKPIPFPSGTTIINNRIQLRARDGRDLALFAGRKRKALEFIDPEQRNFRMTKQRDPYSTSLRASFFRGVYPELYFWAQDDRINRN